jgi:hypothetical protein
MNNPIDQNQAIFKISKEGLEISGSETFVTSQIENFKTSIRDYLLEVSKPLSQPVSMLPAVFNKQSVPSNSISQFPPGNSEDIDFVEISAPMIINYENVLEIQHGKVHIITDVPGDTLAKRMINLILIYLWGNLLVNDQGISFTELREVCQKHGEIDKANFAKHMHAHKKYFVVTGSGKFQSAKLIRPGIKEAIKLITELNKD